MKGRPRRHSLSLSSRRGSLSSVGSDDGAGALFSPSAASAGSLELSCTCLNVTVFVARRRKRLSEEEQASLRDISFPAAPGLAGVLDTHRFVLPEVTSTRAAGEWVVYRCWNCQMDAFALDEETRLRVAVSARMLPAAEAEAAAARDDYEELFGVVVPFATGAAVPASPPSRNTSPASSLGGSAPVVGGAFAAEVENALQRMRAETERRVEEFAAREREALRLREERVLRHATLLTQAVRRVGSLGDISVAGVHNPSAMGSTPSPVPMDSAAPKRLSSRASRGVLAVGADVVSPTSPPHRGLHRRRPSSAQAVPVAAAAAAPAEGEDDDDGDDGDDGTGTEDDVFLFDDVDEDDARRRRRRRRPRRNSTLPLVTDEEMESVPGAVPAAAAAAVAAAPPRLGLAPPPALVAPSSSMPISIPMPPDHSPGEAGGERRRGGPPLPAAPRLGDGVEWPDGGAESSSRVYSFTPLQQ